MTCCSDVFCSCCSGSRVPRARPLRVLSDLETASTDGLKREWLVAALAGNNVRRCTHTHTLARRLTHTRPNSLPRPDSLSETMTTMDGAGGALCFAWLRSAIGCAGRRGGRAHWSACGKWTESEGTPLFKPSGITCCHPADDGFVCAPDHRASQDSSLCPGAVLPETLHSHRDAHITTAVSVAPQPCSPSLYSHLLSLQRPSACSQARVLAPSQSRSVSCLRIPCPPVRLAALPPAIGATLSIQSVHSAQPTSRCRLPPLPQAQQQPLLGSRRWCRTIRGVASPSRARAPSKRLSPAAC